MNKKKEVIKNTIIIFLGKISTQFLSFLLLPLYTARLSSSDYGIVDLIITYISLFVPIITLQQEMALFRFLVDFRNDDIKKKCIISTTLHTTLKILLCFSLLYAAIISFTNINYKIWILANIIVVIFSNLFLQISRGFGDNIKFSIASFITASTSIAMNLLLILVFNYGANAILISSCIGNIACIIYLFFSLKIYRYISTKCISPSIRKELLKYSIPLIPNGVSWWVLNVSDRTIITSFLGASYNGIYAISSKFPNILNGFFAIFGLSWTESASLHINDPDRDEFFSDIFNNTFRIFSCLCMLLIASMPFVFKVMIDSNYNEAYKYIPILIISTFLSCISSIYGGIYIAKKKTNQIASTSIISAIINVVVNLLLIKQIGLYAASISTLVSYAIMTFYRAYDIRQYAKIKYDYKIIIIFVLMIIIELFFYSIDKLVWNTILLISILFSTIVFNYDLIKNIVNTFISKIRRGAM